MFRSRPKSAGAKAGKSNAEEDSKKPTTPQELQNPPLPSIKPDAKRRRRIAWTHLMAVLVPLAIGITAIYLPVEGEMLLYRWMTPTNAAEEEVRGFAGEARMRGTCASPFLDQPLIKQIRFTERMLDFI